jgi:DNA-binding Lrp family transcriptional regulator
MAYKVKLISPAEREARIRASVTASTQAEDFYDFRSEKTALKVIRIDAGLPIYRMENFRTFIEQKEFTVREGKPADYFQTSQENESVQQLQHEILAKLARTGRADSIAPVIDVLKKEKQRERILITHRGVVVNGNRRLAGMRELYSEDSATNAEFSHVACMVLPDDATREEIVDIEAALQAKPETKLDYDWIGDAKLIGLLMSLGRKPADIAKRLNRKEKEVRNRMQALAEAEMYLKDWAKSEEYSKARDAEQLFHDLPGLLEGKDAQLEEASRVIAWTLYDNKGALGDRLYAFNVAIGKRAADVLDKVAGDLGIALGSGVPSGADDDFDVALDDTSAVSYEPVIDALRNPDRRDDAVQTLLEASQWVVESERSQKSETAALKAVTAAHSKLTEVDLSKAATKTYGAIGKQLDAVIARATELKTKLDTYVAKGGKPPDSA